MVGCDIATLTAFRNGNKLCFHSPLAFSLSLSIEVKPTRSHFGFERSRGEEEVAIAIDKHNMIEKNTND